MSSLELDLVPVDLYVGVKIQLAASVQFAQFHVFRYWEG